LTTNHVFDSIKELKVLIKQTSNNEMLIKYLNCILCKYYLENWDKADLKVEELRERNMIRDLMDVSSDQDICMVYEALKIELLH